MYMEDQYNLVVNIEYVIKGCRMRKVNTTSVVYESKGDSYSEWYITNVVSEAGIKGRDK